jgi:ATP-dependent DNA helicase HFM1/MER3
MVKKGVGYHHAGLDLKDRALIEQLFLNGQLLALCSTGTLAVGVRNSIEKSLQTR